MRFGVFSRCERRYPSVNGCNSGACQKISWEQVVMRLARSKEHFKSSTGGGGGGGGGVLHGSQVISRAIDRLSKVHVLSLKPNIDLVCVCGCEYGV